MVENYAKFRNSLLIAALALVVTLLGTLYSVGQAATTTSLQRVLDNDARQDRIIEQLLINNERMRVLADEQARTNSRLEHPIR